MGSITLWGVLAQKNGRATSNDMTVGLCGTAAIAVARNSLGRVG